MVPAVRTGGKHTALLGTHVTEMPECIRPRKHARTPIHSSTLRQSPVLQTTQMFAVAGEH